jgi:hypothetical protein
VQASGFRRQEGSESVAVTRNSGKLFVWRAIQRK